MTHNLLYQEQCNLFIGHGLEILGIWSGEHFPKYTGELFFLCCTRNLHVKRS